MARNACHVLVDERRSLYVQVAGARLERHCTIILLVITIKGDMACSFNHASIGLKRY